MKNKINIPLRFLDMRSKICTKFFICKKWNGNCSWLFIKSDIEKLCHSLALPVNMVLNMEFSNHFWIWFSFLTHTHTHTGYTQSYDHFTLLQTDLETKKNICSRLQIPFFCRMHARNVGTWNVINNSNFSKTQNISITHGRFWISLYPNLRREA